MAYNYPKKEEEILKFWEEKKIFEKTLEKTKNKRSFVFYDGPPFATGLPHYGHILGSVAKDVFPRYKTMQDFFVARRWGWDCHGLPIENIVEKELGISGKKDIETKIGVEKFNETCRSKVLTYTKEWKKMVDRIGRFVDFDNSYKTMDSTYMESVWWALKTLWDKNLIYEGKKVLMYCPHCETPVSKAEVAMDNTYETEKDLSVVVKFRLANEKNTYFLAWTTTPWSLMSTMGLAIDEKADYVKIFYKDEYYILAESRVEQIMNGLGEYKITDRFKGKKIEGVKYEHLYDFYRNNKEVLQRKHLFQTFATDYVEMTEGTGIVTINPAYGEIDFESGKKFDLPVIVDVDQTGHFENTVTKFAGKKAQLSNELIADELKQRNLLLRADMYEHSYPHCWRCDSKLFYRALSAWFINIQKDKKKFVKLNEKINWYPEHLKHGRFLNILEDAPDWNISRNRYWATPLPFFKCECGHLECIGSVKELKEKAINFDEVYKSDKVGEIDLHKDKADKIKLKCQKCGKEMQRTPEVIDCWVESASMPFAELHYPFENKEQFKKRLPAEYIAEYIAQTRTWFYYMHVLSILLFDNIAFENVVCTGTILSEKGEKLSKSKQNYTDPWIILEQYGADALRFYLMSNPVMQAEDLFFNDRDVRDVYNKIINPLCNAAEFYQTYASKSVVENEPKKAENVLDKWILSKLNNFIGEITKTMDGYNTIKSCRFIKDFIEDLSLWYVRRSRDRFKEDGLDKRQAEAVLRIVLLNFSKAIASILPFTAEFVYEKIKLGENAESIHLENWPEQNKKLIDKDLEEKMDEVRKIVSLVLSERIAKGIKVRQPLASLKIKNLKSKIRNDNQLTGLIKDEVNIKEIIFDEEIEKEIELDTNITEELRKEGKIREIIRGFRSERKELGLSADVMVGLAGTGVVLPIESMEKIKKEINAKKFVISEPAEDVDIKKEITIDGKTYWIFIKK
ncbi:MAG: isoleucine--tRNA ligase [Candidatus Staskawiczbacteria bacterium]|jgi:isoleucyl-tRNA synthetase